MSIWQDQPTVDDSLPNYRIMRVPAGRKISGIVISDDVIGTNLHYWKGRSQPCRKEECEACQNGHKPRWKGYILIMCMKTRNISILEFTDRVYREIGEFRKQKGTIRGGMMTFFRTNSKNNGPLSVTIEENLYDATSLPPEEDLRSILERIWEVRQQMLPGLVVDNSDYAEKEEARLA